VHFQHPVRILRFNVVAVDVGRKRKRPAEPPPAPFEVVVAVLFPLFDLPLFLSAHRKDTVRYVYLDVLPGKARQVRFDGVAGFGLGDVDVRIRDAGQASSGPVKPAGNQFVQFVKEGGDG
jgi:hypothetical protein